LQSELANPKHNVDLVCEMYNIVCDVDKNPYYNIMFVPDLV
jgi:hypothetical protein